MPKPTRLALEMALHEEQEIAAVADRLLLPAGTDAFFKKYGTDPESRSRLHDA